MARLVFLTDFSEAYARELILGIVRYTQQHDKAWSMYRLPLSIRDQYGLEQVVEWAKRMKADAIIGQFYKNENVELFRQNGIIAIAQDFKERFNSIPNITGAHITAGEMGADYFIQRGFRHFAFYGIPHVVWSDERYLGFKRRIKAQGRDYTFSEFRNNNEIDIWKYDSAELLEWLVSLPKPVAIMACDDNYAYHIAEICGQHEEHSRLRIPADIALLGVDNDQTICKLSIPNLSSINQNVELGGYQTALLIENMINNPDMEFEDVVVMPTYIATRKSTDHFAVNDPHVATLLRYINTNLHTKLTIDQLVKLVPLSRRQAEQRFDHEMKCTIHDYIISLRIEKFKEQICRGKSITDAAIETGFSDVKNVSRVFKQREGITPSEYRKIMQTQIL